MPRERLSMRTIREVLRLNQQGHSLRFIASSCRIGITTVREYLYRASTAGVAWPLHDDVTDQVLDGLLYPALSPSGEVRPIPDWSKVVVELRRKKGVTLFLLWEEYRAVHSEGYGYSRYCELYQEYSQTLDPRMRQVHSAGEKLFVDYAGMTVPVTDRATGEVHEVQIFVATMGASDYTYVEGTWTQALPDWISSHVRALNFFGGVPEIIVPDNLKSGINSPCRYEPDVNATYLKFAEHYGVAIIPARVVKPRDKSKVENHVLAVERRVLAPLRNRVFFALDELNDAMDNLLDDLNNRSFQKIPGNRQELFKTLDAPVLRPLPVDPYVFGIWSKARPGIDYHISVEQSFYSVPYTLIRKDLEVHRSAAVVEVFYQGNRVSSHLRSYTAGSYSTNPLHMPKAHREYAEWTPERLIRWANETGGSTAAMVDAIMQRRQHPQQGFRSCMGIMRLGKTYGAERLEAACKRGLKLGAISYKSVKSILETKLDQAQEPEQELSTTLPAHSNIRGAGYYRANTSATDPQTTLSFHESTSLLIEERPLN